MAASPVRDFLGVNGEWAIQNNDFAVVGGADAVPQLIQTAVSMFRGECWLDETVGVDYFGKILVKNPDPLVVRAEIGAVIAGVVDVVSVVGAELVPPDNTSREAVITYAVDTLYSQQPVNGNVAVP